MMARRTWRRRRQLTPRAASPAPRSPRRCATRARRRWRERSTAATPPGACRSSPASTRSPGSSATSPGSPSSGSCAARTSSAPTASSPRARAADDRRPRRDLRFGAARPRRALARRAAVARRARRRGSRASSTPASTRSLRDDATTTPRTTSTASPCSTRTCTARPSPGCARRSAGRRQQGWPLPTLAGERAAGASPAARSCSAAPPTQRGFAFDNEQPARPVRVAPFEIDADAADERRVPRASSTPAATTTPTLWPGAAGALARAPALPHPQRWRRDAIGALADALVRPLAAARRRRARDPRQRLGGRGVLPLGRATPAERRRVGMRDATIRASTGGKASGSGPPTRSCPTPDSSPDPTPTTRGRGSAIIASCAAARSPPTSGCTHPRYRNFFTPDRSDVFAGFRTAAMLTLTGTSSCRSLRLVLAAAALAARHSSSPAVLAQASRRAARLGHPRRSADRAAAQVQAARRLPQAGDRHGRAVHPGDRLRRRRRGPGDATSSTSPGSAASPSCRRACAPTAAPCRSCSAPRTRSSPAASSCRPTARRRRSPT